LDTKLEPVELPRPIAALGWLFAGMMFLYPIHELILLRDAHEFALQQPAFHQFSAFDLRGFVTQCTMFGWAGGWGFLLGVGWLAGVGGLWIYDAFHGRTLAARSRRPFMAVVLGLLVVASILVGEILRLT
jgi:hypothetical protein